jgi:hypothetical protein
MKTTVKEITPQWAKKILETRNPRNRRLSEAFVAKLARDISAGAFVTTHQGIAFDTNGDLLDGQHRLAAIVLANKPVVMPMSTGIETTHRLNGASINTFEVIDGGKPRGVGQMLQMAGYANGNRVAAITKSALMLCAKLSHNIGISTAQTHKALLYFGNSAQACASIAAGLKIIKPQSWAVGPIALYHASHPELAEQFLRDVGDVTGEQGSASRALAAYCRNTHGMAGGGSYLTAAKVAASALFHGHNKTKVSRLYANDSALEWLLGLNKPLTEKLARIITL